MNGTTTQRNPEADAHWCGYWFCETCNFYTGQLQFHHDHVVIRVKCKHEHYGDYEKGLVIIDSLVDWV